MNLKVHSALQYRVTEIQTGGYLWRSFFLILPSEHDQLDGAQDLGQLRLTCWFFFLFLSNCDMWCCSLCLLPLILSFCTSVFSVHSHKVVEKKNHKKTLNILPLAFSDLNKSISLCCGSSYAEGMVFNTQ